MTAERIFEKAEELAQSIRDEGLYQAHLRIHEQGLTECEDCDTTINPQRRAAYPAARRCTDCQQIFERQERQYGR